MAGAWRYIGYKVGRGLYASNSWTYWSNAAGGGSDVAIANWYDGEITDMPPACAEINYGALDDYNGDIIALIDDWGITRESVDDL